MGEQAVSLAALTLAGTIAGGFFTLVNKQNKTHEKIANAVEALTISSNKETEALVEVAKATKQSAKEAQDRNGHLGKIASKTLDVATKTLERMEKTALIAAEDRDVLVKGKK